MDADRCFWRSADKKVCLPAIENTRQPVIVIHLSTSALNFCCSPETRLSCIFHHSGRHNERWLFNSKLYQTFGWFQQRTGGDKIVEILDSAGIPLDAHASYRVAVASYHAAGGDGFDVLTEGTERITGLLVLDALIDYISAQPQPVEVHIEGRIKRRN